MQWYHPRRTLGKSPNTWWLSIRDSPTVRTIRPCILPTVLPKFHSGLDSGRPPLKLVTESNQIMVTRTPPPRTDRNPKKGYNYNGNEFLNVNQIKFLSEKNIHLINKAVN